MKKIVFYVGSLSLAAVCLFSASFGLGEVSGAVAETEYPVLSSERPLLYEANGILEGNETASFSLPSPVSSFGDSLRMKVYVQTSYYYTLGIKLSFTDSAGKVFTYEQTDGDRVDLTDSVYGERKAELRKDGFAEIPVWFNGDVTFGNEKLSGPTGATLSEIAEVSVTFRAASMSPYVPDNWLNDHIRAYLYGIEAVDTSSGTAVTVVDFCTEKTIPSLTCKGGNVKGELRRTTDRDMFLAEYSQAKEQTSCKTMGDVTIVEDFDEEESLAAISPELATEELSFRFYGSGQPSKCSFVPGRNGGSRLKNYLDPSEYDPAYNSYSATHFFLSRKEARDWSGAKGVSLYVRNANPHIVSITPEIFQYNSDTGKLEQYNLNSSGMKYKTVYAYDVNTGLESSWHTQTFLRIPAHFEGWIRIPFSQYDAPLWSMSEAYGNKGELNTEKYEIVTISLTRLFSSNQDTAVEIDDVGFYTSDFQVGESFVSDKQSIKECLGN